MARAEIGSTVTISYVGTLDNGRIFHSTDEHGPLTVTLGSEQLFPALEQALIGMGAGEVKNVVLSADETYGSRRQENIIQVPRSAYFAGKDVTIGQKLSIQFKGGVSRMMQVIEASETEVTMDGNHPLAGCELTFVIRIDRVE